MNLQEIGALLKAKKVPSLTETARNFVRYNYLQPLQGRPSLPKALLIYVTYRCNARCIMCGIWKDHEFSQAETELSLADLDHILSDRLFAEIEYVNLNGGEPTLRADLVEMAHLILRKLPHLKHLSLNSNGLLSSRLVSSVQQILAACHQKNIPFSLVVSLHGSGELADQIFGVPNVFKKAQNTLSALKALDGGRGNFLSLNCAINKLNAPHLPQLLEWCDRNNLRINFVLAEVRERFFNLDMADRVEVKGERKEEAIQFLRRMVERERFKNPVAFRYYCLANMLEHNTERDLACHYAIGCLILGSHGTLYYCPHSKAIGNCRQQSAYEIYYNEANLQYRQLELLRETCLHCPPNTFNRLEFQADIFKFLRFLVKPQTV